MSPPFQRFRRELMLDRVQGALGGAAMRGGSSSGFGLGLGGGATGARVGAGRGAARFAGVFPGLAAGLRRDRPRGRESDAFVDELRTFRFLSDARGELAPGRTF
jgi:hypothetical protein